MVNEPFDYFALAIIIPGVLVIVGFLGTLLWQMLMAWIKSEDMDPPGPHNSWGMHG